MSGRGTFGRGGGGGGDRGGRGGPPRHGGGGGGGGDRRPGNYGGGGGGDRRHTGYGGGGGGGGVDRRHGGHGGGGGGGGGDRRPGGGGGGRGGPRGGPDRGPRPGGKAPRTKVEGSRVLLNQVAFDITKGVDFKLYSLLAKGPNDSVFINFQNVKFQKAFHQKILTAKLHEKLQEIFGSETKYTYDNGALIMTPVNHAGPAGDGMEFELVIEGRKPHGTAAQKAPDADVHYTFQMELAKNANDYTLTEFELRYSHVVNNAIERLITDKGDSVRVGGGKRVFYPASNSPFGQDLNAIIDHADPAVKRDTIGLVPFQPRRGFCIGVSFIGCQSDIKTLDSSKLTSAIKDGKFEARMTILPKTGAYYPKTSTASQFQAEMCATKADGKRGPPPFSADIEKVFKCARFHRIRKIFEGKLKDSRKLEAPIRISHFGDPAGRVSFKRDDGTEETVAQYFKRVYNLQCDPKSPVLVLDQGPPPKIDKDKKDQKDQKAKGPTYLPMEALEVRPQFVSSFQNILQNNTTNVARINTARFKKSVETIIKHMVSHKECNATMTEWGLRFKDKTLMSVPAVLPIDPSIVYGSGSAPVSGGNWNMARQSMYKKADLADKAALVINLSFYGHSEIQTFASQFFRQVKLLLDLNPRVMHVDCSRDMLAHLKDGKKRDDATFRASINQRRNGPDPRVQQWRNKFETLMDRDILAATGLRSLAALKDKVGCVFVVLPGRPALQHFTDAVYAAVKALATRKWGIPSQCFKSDKTPYIGVPDPRFAEMHLAGIFSGANIKCGMANFVVNSPTLKRMHDAKSLVVGCDLMHAMHGEQKISVLGLVASTNLMEHQYVALANYQPYENDIAQGMDSLAETLLDRHIAGGGKKPEHLIYFRDGVDHGSHEAVTEHEVKPLVKAITTKHNVSNLKVTVILCLKRHQTRILPVEDTFTQSKSGQSMFPNVDIGTIVGVAPKGHQMVYTGPSAQETTFYINGHSAIPNSTSVPLRVCVTRNDSGLEPFDLATFSYAVHHQDQVVTKAISLPAPVMYSHKLCEFIKAQGDWADATEGRFTMSLPEVAKLARDMSDEMSNLAIL